MKKYEILGENLPVVVCELSPGESMITESGSMSWMSPNMKMGDHHRRRYEEDAGAAGVRRFRISEQVHCGGRGRDHRLRFQLSRAIKALNISAGRSMIVQKSAFLASEEGVELSMHFQKNWAPASLAARASSCRN